MKINIELVSEPLIIPRHAMSSIKYRGFSGVYVMYDESHKCMYVGKTSNLFNRLGDHRRKSLFYRSIYYIKFYHFRNEFKKDVLETYLINELKPLYNIQKTYYKQDDYELMLSDIEDEVEELISEISYREYYLYTDVAATYIDVGESNLDFFVSNYEQSDLSNRAEEELEVAALRQRLNRLYERKTNITRRMSL